MNSPNPFVGILWLFNGKVIIDISPLTEAEDCGEFQNHRLSHEQFWRQLQSHGSVPPEVEYDEPPRGRVVYNKTAKRFTFLADKCILREKNLVSRIMAAMNLPPDTATATDSQYRCSVCVSRTQREN